MCQYLKFDVTSVINITDTLIFKSKSIFMYF